MQANGREMSAKILVVEDEPDINELIVVSVRLAGFEVMTTDNAESAWQLLSTGLPEVVLLDWMLPGMSGFHLIRHMRADARLRDIPVIMLTARTDEVNKISALGNWCRRLCDEAVFAAGTGGAHQGGDSPV